MRPPVIMVVEDNAVTRKQVRRSLEAAGFGVVEAPDGKTALERAATVDLALIVQDMHLPDTGGFELLEQLRMLPGTAEIPIIAMTGWLPDRASGTFEFSDVLLKPVDSSRLIRVINALIMINVAPEPHVIRRRALVAEDDLVQRKIIRLHLQHWGFDVVEAVDGAGALRLATESPPDVIVSDLLMPEMDGLSLCVAIRGNPVLSAVPFVLVSSYHVDEIDRTLATHSGATAIVSRTHDMGELGAALDAIRRCEETRPRDRERSRTTRDDISHLVQRIQRDSELRDALVESRATLSALLPFFERFAEVGTHQDTDGVIDGLLAGYLDASGAALGCMFLSSPTGLVLRGHLGFRAEIAAEELPTFLGRFDLLERALATNETLELPSAGACGPEIDHVLRRTGAMSLLLVPLTIRGDHFGVLVLGSHQPTSSTDRLRLAEAARGPIGQALALSRSVGELVTSRAAFRGIVDSSSDGIVVADRGSTITYANPAAQTIFGCTKLAGHRADEIMPFLAGHADATTGVGLRADGTTFPAAVTVTTFEDTPGHELCAYLIRDLSLRETLDKLAALANRDGLTDLFNRRRFDEHLTSRIGESIRYEFIGALIVVDLDGFKAINDTHGHQAGDAVLQAVANILRSGIRSSDFVSRLGGDEFAIELPHTELDAAVVVARKLLDAVRAPIEWRGRSLRIAMSAGIAMYPSDGANLEQLVGTADAALYRSKSAGRNQISTTSLTWEAA